MKTGPEADLSSADLTELRSKAPLGEPLSEFQADALEPLADAEELQPFWHGLRCFRDYFEQFNFPIDLTDDDLTGAIAGHRDRTVSAHPKGPHGRPMTRSERNRQAPWARRARQKERKRGG